ncbi:hypothetical protein [Empedobacter falsenii]
MKIEFNQNYIEKIFKSAQEFILNKDNITHINYIDFDHNTFDYNNKDFLEGISKKSIVYCLWTGENIISLEPKYIGHSESKSTRQRLRNHLTKKNSKTGAQLLNIIEELKLKKIIAVSYVIVAPSYMRKSLEEWLIYQNGDRLLWNRIGK